MTQNNIESPINITPVILAIDSTAGACSISIWKNSSISAYCEELATSLQAKRLIIMVEEALSKSSTKYSELSSVACTVGPGSFTGIRIGLASARAIGFAANIPVMGFSALEVMAYGAISQSPGKNVVSILNAGKGEIVYQYFTSELKAKSSPALGKMEDIDKSMIIAGLGGTNNITFPRADFLAGLAANYPGHAVEPLPYYVRPPDAKLPQDAAVNA